MFHRVKHSKWENNELVHYEGVFETLESALTFARKIEDGLVKIYNEAEELVHSWECKIEGEHHHHESYA